MIGFISTVTMSAFSVTPGPLLPVGNEPSAVPVRNEVEERMFFS